MKDEIYVFYEDVKEKSITARGAHSRPSRRKLRAPNYTKKELQKMTGQVNSINLNAVMPYAYFKTLPESLKKEYIQNLISKYDAGPTEIARVLGMGVKNCSVQLRNLGFTFNRGHRQSAENVKRMRTDYGISTATVAAPTKKMALQNVSFTFSGVFDASELTKQLSAVIPDGQTVCLSIIAEIKEVLE